MRAGRGGAPDGMLTRREALARLAGGLAVPSILLAACDGPGRGEDGLDPTRVFLEPVDLDPRRVIRSYVCARPYRPSGFRIEMERVGETVLVHNYGHGGGGFTLSWGTGELAADHLREAGAPSGSEVAVVGCGVVGLTTAMILAERGYSVRIYAADLPPDTTSDLAGANFYPSKAVDPSLLTPEFGARLEEACRVSHARFVSMMEDPRYRISWKPQYFLSEEWNEEIAAGDPIYEALRDLYPNPRLLEGGDHPFRTRYAFRDENLFIEPSPYLSALVSDFRDRGGTIERRAFASLDEVAALEEDWVMNCTGLGAATLAGDVEVRPNPSQILILEPQPGVDYAAYSTSGAYMFPRSDGIMLGRSEGVVTPEEIFREQALLVPGGSRTAARGGHSRPVS